MKILCCTLSLKRSQEIAFKDCTSLSETTVLYRRKAGLNASQPEAPERRAFTDT